MSEKYTDQYLTIDDYEHSDPPTEDDLDNYPPFDDFEWWDEYWDAFSNRRRYMEAADEYPPRVKDDDLHPGEIEYWERKGLV